MTTIKDVAREAEVSIATVSRVINGLGNVTDVTRARILGVAARLRYVPDSAARCQSAFGASGSSQTPHWP